MELGKVILSVTPSTAFFSYTHWSSPELLKGRRCLILLLSPISNLSIKTIKHLLLLCTWIHSSQGCPRKCENFCIDYNSWSLSNSSSHPNPLSNFFPDTPRLPHCSNFVSSLSFHIYPTFVPLIYSWVWCYPLAVVWPIKIYCIHELIKTLCLIKSRYFQAMK